MNAMKGLWLLALVGCSGALDGAGDDTQVVDGAASGDAVGCYVSLRWEPDPAIASDNIKLRVDPIIEGASGIFNYNWAVSYNNNPVAFEPAQPDNSAIQFPIPTSGVYNVTLNLDAGVSCTSGFAAINVEQPGANVEEMRIRVRPPANSDLPPKDKFVPIKGGQPMFTVGGVVLDSGRLVQGTVSDGATPVSAYLKLSPIAARDAYVEQFAGADGNFTVRVVSEPHDVLIIPSIDGYAPKLVKGWTPDQAALSIDAGDAIGGTVRDASNAAIAGAKVQITIDGVPSTLGETDGAGAFTVRGRKTTGPVIVDVTPPPARGLPRLVATSAAWNLDQSVAVKYTIGTRNVGTATVRRGGAAVPNARVAIVGTTPAIGSVTAGLAVTATGTTRISVVADGTGKLPSALAPAADLFAVTQVAGSGANADLAVSALDLTVVPALVDAPPRVAIATALRTSVQDPIEGAILDAIPAGPLGLAGAPTLRFVSDAAGAISGLWPANSKYDLRAHDPAGGGSLKRFDGVTPGTIATGYSLGVPLKVLGRVTSSETLQPIGGASVQILCASCTGIDRDRPFGEAATNGNGDFAIVVPDPGTSSLQRLPKAPD